MGCWNGTCALSNLPIMYGDRVKLIFICAFNTAPIPGANHPISPSYPDDVWSALPLVVSGTYNDYGSIENVDDDIFIDAGLKVFQKLKTSGRLKIETDKYTSDVDFETMAQFADIVERGRVTVKHPYRHNDGFLQLAFCLIREDIWNVVVKSYKPESWQPKRRSPEPREFASTLERLSSAKFVQQRLFDELRGHASIFDRPDLYASELDKELDEKFKTSVEKFSEQLDRQNEFWTIYSAMHPLRKSFAPQSGGGSQDTDFELHAALATTVLDICYKAISRYDDE